MKQETRNMKTVCQQPTKAVAVILQWNWQKYTQTEGLNIDQSIRKCDNKISIRLYNIQSEWELVLFNLSTFYMYILPLVFLLMLHTLKLMTPHRNVISILYAIVASAMKFVALLNGFHTMLQLTFISIRSLSAWNEMKFFLTESKAVLALHLICNITNI